MFCKECGAQNVEEAKFCASCGKDLQQGEKSGKNNKEVLYSLKPTFNWGYKILTRVVLTIIWVVLFIFIFLGEFFEDVNTRNVEETVGAAGIIIGFIAIATIIYIIAKLVIEKMQYNKLNYNFYGDKIEYIDGFLNVSQKELKYKHIRETLMTQNIIERIFGIGTIKLTTNASSGFGYNNRFNKGTEGMNGIFIHCVENPKEHYEKIKEIINDGSEE